jgi:glycosyltransferase involved in cell wall biosynthesis
LKVAVVIPAYNEGRTIRRIVEKVLKYSREVVVVDDGSSDNTFSEATEAGAILLNSKKNMGKFAVLKLGFETILSKQNADCIIQLDGDGQHDPDDIPNFIKEIESGADVVIGQRDFNLRKMPFLRILSNIISTLVITILFTIWLKDTQCGYRAYKKEILEKLLPLIKNSGFEGEAEMLAQADIHDLKIKGVKIHTIYDNEDSKVDPLRDIKAFATALAKTRIRYSRDQLNLLRRKFIH